MGARNLAALRAAAVVALAGCHSATIVVANAEPNSCRQPWMPEDAPAVCEWRAAPSLPTPRTYHVSAVDTSVLYVAGGLYWDGTQLTYYDQLLYTVVDADGMPGTWSTGPSFTQGRSGAGMTVHDGCLYLVGGGWSDSAGNAFYGADVQSMPVDAAGPAGAWIVGTSTLSTPRSNLSLLAVTTDGGPVLYAIAGVTQIGSDTVHLDTIEYAPLLDDCQVGPWNTSPFHLHGGRSTPQALVLDGDLAVIGGWGDLDVVDIFSDVQIAPTRDDGTIGPIRRPSGRLPSGMYGHGTAAVAASPEPMLLTVGGQPGVGAYANWIAYAYANGSAVGHWSISPKGQLPSSRAGLTSNYINGALVVAGGSGSGGQYFDQVLSAKITAGKP